jgi:hypothetical protein
MQKTSLFLVVLLCGAFPLFLPACHVVPGGSAGVSPAPGNGPPSHAPAHGYRRNHAYRYYPSAQVYFSPERNTYFYLEGSTWRMSASLPLNLQVRLGDHVTIEMDSDTPYRDFDKHKSKYPPGKLKKKR